MVTVAIMAVLAALAAPSFTPLVERWRVRQAAQELESTLYFARSEAIKRGGGVSILKSGDVDGCTNAGSNTLWGCGWEVFADANGNGTKDAGEASLQLTAPPDRVAIELTGSNGYIAVDRWGMLAHGGGAPTALDFLLTPQGKDADANGATRLCTGTGGRIVQVKGSDSCT